MQATTAPPKVKRNYVTFKINDKLFGLDILNVREINRQTDATHVPQAPDFVHGLINLRGQIVTILDLKHRLGMGRSEANIDSHNIILKGQAVSAEAHAEADDRVGILVDTIGDIIAADSDTEDVLPANMDERDAQYLSGVVKLNDTLIGILNVQKVLAHAPQAEG